MSCLSNLWSHKPYGQFNKLYNYFRLIKRIIYFHKLY